MKSELIRNFEKTRNAVLEAAKAIPQQLRAQTIELPKVEVNAFGLTLLSMPKRTIDLTKIELPKIEMPKTEVFTDKLGQIKVLAPVDIDAIQARVNDAAGAVQKLAAGTTAKAREIVGDLKTRPILFVPARTPAKPAAKPAAKKTTKSSAKKTSTGTNGTASA